MITIPVDEAYAFDFLSILIVKKSAQIKEVEDHISRQIGISEYQKIFESIEFKNMIDINQKTFDMVDRAKRNDTDAKSVDDCNMKRYYAKLSLQNKFFHSDLKEIKK